MNRKLNWTSAKVWGSVGNTHRAEIGVGAVTWTFVIDQPTPGNWQARGWADGTFAFYRVNDGYNRTLKAQKAACQAFVDRLASDGTVNR